MTVRGTLLPGETATYGRGRPNGEELCEPLRIGEDMTRKREHNRAIAALFARELKAQRDARGWTQDELAARTNYAPSTIASVETMTLKPQPKCCTARSLSRASCMTS
jgi:ribosome-binding protein aMBF1 (putative translation factor)